MNDVVEVFRGRGIQPWYIRLKSPNGRVLSISEGYATRWNAKRAARRMFPGVEIREVRT